MGAVLLSFLSLDTKGLLSENRAGGGLRNSPWLQESCSSSLPVFQSLGSTLTYGISGKGKSRESGVDLKLKLSQGSANGIIHFLRGVESHHVPSVPFYLLNHEKVWPFSKRKSAEHVMQVWSTICLGRGFVRERKR